MNGAPRIIPKNVAIEDAPEPGDPPPRKPSSPLSQPQTPPSQPPANVTPPPITNPTSPLPEPSRSEIPLTDIPILDHDPMTSLENTSDLIRQATMPILPPDMDDFGIPPSPPGSPSSLLTQKIENIREWRERGVYFNDNLASNKSFRNPRILEKLRGYAGIQDQYSSHLSTSIWNPHGFPDDWYYEALGN
jgi:HCNGP-like protein